MTGIHDYSDIINLPRPEPRFHQRMPIGDRAAQFAPFAALTGFSGVIEETGRVTEEKIHLDDREKERISRKLQRLQDEIKQQPDVTVTFFVPDAKKSGGSYQKFRGKLKKIDSYEKRVIFVNGMKINFDDILKIEREI